MYSQFMMHDQRNIKLRVVPDARPHHACRKMNFTLNL